MFGFMDRKSSQPQEQLAKDIDEHFAAPTRRSSTSSVFQKLRDATVRRPSQDSTMQSPPRRPTAGLDSRRTSNSSTYSEQANEEAHLSQEERVRIAVARLQGPQYGELRHGIFTHY